MRAYNRDPALQTSLEQATGVARLPSPDVDGREQEDGGVLATDREQELANLERATREVAEFQVYWRSRDSQCRQMVSPQHPTVEEPSDIQGNQALTKLHIAQNEWKKLLDGSGSEEARRPMLPVAEAMQNVHWGGVRVRRKQVAYSVFTHRTSMAFLWTAGEVSSTRCAK